jgi:serine phosphatase RsbU (regulator of sigma subunit)
MTTKENSINKSIEKKNINMQFKYLLLIVFIGYNLTMYSQNSTEYGSPIIKHYKHTDYEGYPQVWSCVQDKRGLMYFADNLGIREFDGKKWRHIKNSKGGTVRTLKISDNGRIYVGSDNEFGYLEPDEQGKIQYALLSDKLPDSTLNFGAVWTIAIAQNSIYFFADKYTFKYYKNKISVKSTNYTPLYGKSINDELLVFDEKGIIKNTTTLKIKISGRGIYSIIHLSEKKILVANQENNWSIYDLETKEISKFESPAMSYLLKHVIFKAIKLDKNSFAVTTKTGGIVILSNKGKILHIINKNRGLPDCKVYNVYPDKDKNLWACTSNGIVKIDISFPLLRFGAKQNIKEYVLTSKVFNNKKYIGSFDGLFYLPKYTMSENDNHKFKKIYNSETWDFTSLNNILFAIGKWHLLLINDTIVKKIVIFERNDLSYCIGKSKKFSNSLFIGMSDRVRYFRFNDNFSFDNIEVLETFDFREINEEINSITQDKDGNLWITTRYTGVYFVRFTGNSVSDYKISRMNEKNGLKDIDETYIYNIDDEILIAADNGILKAKYPTDNKSDSTIQFEYSSIFKDKIKDRVEQILKVEENKYLINGSSFFYAIIENGNIKLDTCSFKRIKQTFNIYKASINPDKSISFGASDSYLYYNTKIERNFSEKFDVIIRKVIISKDSTIFSGAFYNKSDSLKCVKKKQTPDFIPILDYKLNSITIHFAALFYEDTEKTTFQYKLEGYNDKWTKLTKENKAVYTNLHEGEYKFLVKAQNVYGTLSYITEYSFKILAPWYRTWWAYIVYFILFLGFIFLIIKIFTRRLIKQKEKLEEIVIERTAEITQQKEEIETQAENLKTANNHLSDKNTEIEIQKTELALKNKNITAGISYAKRIQEAVLPRKEFINQLLPEYMILHKPRDIVSGDFYFINKHKNYIYVAAVDCTGHGVPGAFMSMLGMAILNELVKNPKITNSAQILNELRNKVKYSMQQTGARTEQQDGMDIAFVTINTDTKMISYAGAYNPLWIFRNGKLIEINADRMPVGVYIKEKKFTNHDIRYNENDILYLFSDGYYSQFNDTNGEQIKNKRFKKLLSDIHLLNFEEQKQKLTDYLKNWQGKSKQVDDILIIGIKL